MRSLIATAGLMIACSHDFPKSSERDLLNSDLDADTASVEIDLFLSRDRIMEACDITEMECYEDPTCEDYVAGNQSLLDQWGLDWPVIFTYEQFQLSLESPEYRLCAGDGMEFSFQDTRKFLSLDGYGCQITQYYDNADRGDLNGYFVQNLNPEKQEKLWYCESEGGSYGATVPLVRIAVFEAIESMADFCENPEGCELTIGAY